jgi:hypothetical protein
MLSIGTDSASISESASGFGSETAPPRATHAPGLGPPVHRLPRSWWLQCTCLRSDATDFGLHPAGC